MKVYKDIENKKQNFPISATNKESLWSAVEPELKLFLEEYFKEGEFLTLAKVVAKLLMMPVGSVISRLLKTILYEKIFIKTQFFGNLIISSSLSGSNLRAPPESPDVKRPRIQTINSFISDRNFAKAINLLVYAEDTLSGFKQLRYLKIL